MEALKSGGLPPWKRSWPLDPNCGSPLSLSTLRGYKGINVLILALVSMKNGYRSRWWGSFQAIKQAGGYVRKGEKATAIVFFRPITKTVTTDTGEEKEKNFPLLRTFAVFNVEQTSGLEYLHAGRTELAPAVMDERRRDRRHGTAGRAARWRVRMGNRWANLPAGAAEPVRKRCPGHLPDNHRNHFTRGSHET